jgi:hypothetical protein
MTSSDSIILTIFTPSFNRADLLPRLFDSIQQQVGAGDPVEWHRRYSGNYRAL